MPAARFRTASTSPGLSLPPPGAPTSGRRSRTISGSTSAPGGWSAAAVRSARRRSARAPEQGNCNENQSSQPFTGPDGALYVVWANFNSTVTGGDNRNQILLAKSTDGGNTFGRPVKDADFYDLCLCRLPGRQEPRACVRSGEGRDSEFILPRHELSVGRCEPHATRPGRGHRRVIHQPALQGSERVHPSRLL